MHNSFLLSVTLLLPNVHAEFFGSERVLSGDEERKSEEKEGYSEPEEEATQEEQPGTTKPKTLTPETSPR